MNRPINISSNLTIILKIFFPIFWMMFFGLTFIAFLNSTEAYIGGMPIFWFRLMLLSFIVTGALVMYFSIIQLKRVEIDQDFFYVTNYKQTARYPFHNVEKIEEVSYLFFKVFRLSLRTPGVFGARPFFLASNNRMQKARQEVPEINAMLVKV